MSVAVADASIFTSAVDLLHNWLSRHLDRKSLSWLSEKQAQITEGAPPRVFFTAFSAVPRYTDKSKLELTPDDLQIAAAIRPGWSPGEWHVDQVGRTLLVLSLFHEDVKAYERVSCGEASPTLDQLFTTADIGELVALYHALPLLPHPEQYRDRAAEGVRSNIIPVFNAVALRNPYPADYFDNVAWNQMVLKAIFVGSPLHLIQGLDRRANPDLARMLVDYAHERWAANRPVTPGLWRPVGRFATSENVTDLQRVLNDPDPVQQKAAALACAESPSPEIQALLTRRPDLQAALNNH